MSVRKGTTMRRRPSALKLPMTFEEALADLMKVKPPLRPAKVSNRKVVRKKGRPPKP
jgi:hypothetical protein